MFINRGTYKEYMAHLYNGILLSHKKNKIIPFTATWMVLETVITLSEVSYTKTCCCLNVESGKKKKKRYKWACVQNRNRVTDVEDKFMVIGAKGGGINWEIEIDLYTLVYIKWASQVALVVKNLPAKAGDTSLILGWGRSPGEGHGKPLQYSCLENPMDWGAWWATVHRIAQSQLWLKWCLVACTQPIDDICQKDN